MRGKFREKELQYGEGWKGEKILEGRQKQRKFEGEGGFKWGGK